MQKDSFGKLTEKYFSDLEVKLHKEIKIANNARANGRDPKPTVEIPLAKDLAERVENLIGVPGVAGRIRQLEEQMSREEAALAIGKEIAENKIICFDSRVEAVENAIRVSVAMLTEGVVAAPIEGIDRVDIKQNDDGSEYICIYYAGPIRSAGGTAQALSILVGDYVRRGIKVDRFKPRNEEIERYIEEINLYKNVASLQYMPSEEEMRLIVSNCPVCIDGEPTEQAEVEGYRNLERIPTNRARGGMALVLAEGLALKAPKIQKHVKKLNIGGWEWLDSLISGGNTNGDKISDDNSSKIKPSDKYLRDLIAGRPVLSYPSRPGGFRLRYGRSRNTSFASLGINPASMILMDEFIVTGTQIKTERPGKAAGVAPVDSIEGPTVRLRSGCVIRIDNEIEARAIKAQVDCVLDLGEVLINYGDFLENNHPLIPSSFCFEWWIQECKVSSSSFECDEEKFKNPSQDMALELSFKYNVPLHPKFTYLWHDVTTNEIELLSKFFHDHSKLENNTKLLTFSLEKPDAYTIKSILEKLLVLHRVDQSKLFIDEPLPLLYSLGLNNKLEYKKQVLEIDYNKFDTLSIINELSDLKIFPRSPYRIGARMGRPEKSNRRKMSPAPHVLFPIGDFGGNKRDINAASCFKESMNSKVGEISIQVGNRICPSCNKETHECRCSCGKYTAPKLFCQRCEITVNTDKCPRCGSYSTSIDTRNVDFKSIYQNAFKNLGERNCLDSFKGVKKLMSKHMTPESLEKGILRAKHDLFTFKDGTIRYDMSDMPLTHIRPSEIAVSVDKIKELGYTEDIYGNPLEKSSQILQLKVQDIVISYDAALYLLRATNYIDELLIKHYKKEPYYNAKTIDDIIGSLIIGLAPHTSAGVLGRLVGFTKAAVGFAHPYFHAAKRRNCDGDEDCVMLLMDGLLNFSYEFLPNKRGGKMDAPLVLTTRLDPNEVDKEAHNIDVCSRYPLEFYRAAQKFTNPKDIEDKMDIISNRLGTCDQYEKFMFTHDTSDIACGPVKSAYKTLGTMIEKIDAQLNLADILRSVDASDVAERVLISHFLPDMYGNLRAFSRQGTRCLKCGAKFRRPPLTGKCNKCNNGKVILTVHEGAVKKYLDISMKVSEKYNVSSYTKQRIDLIALDIKSLFENDQSKQMGLSDFM